MFLNDDKEWWCNYRREEQTVKRLCLRESERNCSKNERILGVEVHAFKTTTQKSEPSWVYTASLRSVSETLFQREERGDQETGGGEERGGGRRRRRRKRRGRRRREGGREGENLALR